MDCSTPLASRGVDLARGAYIRAMVHRMNAEDHMLKNEFGKQLEEWAERTPRKVIPFIS